ncbi:MAG: putative DNA-binding protein [Oceanicoccus sp.]|jgi:predicted DNA-binding protein
MNIQQLLQLWETTASGQLTEEHYSIRLPVEDAAKLQALAELYPRRAITEIVTDLLSAALNDVESHMPYVRGTTIVARDEEGDPLYEDVGPTPKFLDLTKKHMSDFVSQQKDHH